MLLGAEESEGNADAAVDTLRTVETVDSTDSLVDVSDIADTVEGTAAAQSLRLVTRGAKGVALRVRRDVALGIRGTLNVTVAVTALLPGRCLA